MTEEDKTVEHQQAAQPEEVRERPELSKKEEQDLARTAALSEANAILQAQTEWLRVTLSSIGDAVIATNTHGRITYMNPVAERTTGWPLSEAEGKPLTEIFVIVNEQTRETVESPVVRVMRENRVVELANHTLLIARDGTEIPIDDTGAPILNDAGLLLGVILVFHNVTDRKKAERALRESEATFRLLFANNPLPMWVYDRETLAFLEVNEAAIAHYGYSREEFLQKTIVDIRPQEDVPRLLADLRTARPSYQRSHIWRHQLRNGRLIDVEITSHTLEFAGRPAALVIAQDITERKRLEDDRTYLMSSALCLLWLADVYETDAPYLHWEMRFPDTAAAQRFLPLALNEGETYREGWYRYRIPEDRDRCDEIALESIRAGRSYQQEFRCQSADGTLRWLHEDIRITTLEPGKHWRAVGVCTDITERKRLEDQLLQAQKLESVGRLAGGVAHDFNNLLAILAGHAELAEEELPADSPVQEHIRVIREAGDRAANLTRQLLAFARKQVIEPRVINLNDLTLGMEKMLRRLIGENIDLVTHLQPDLARVHVDPGQFEQILVNLVVNARDAMPEGGRLTIETENAVIDEEYARLHMPLTPGFFVTLTVSDTGEGMDETVQKRIFEPFFTTKEQGKGTGLGLATVYGVVKQSGGHIWLYSEPGHGSLFKIYLPAAEGESSLLEETEERETSLQGAETILVVEDEPTLRSLTAGSLRKLGYRVLEAVNGEMALWVAAEHLAPIHLLVTDVVMPRMGGKDLADRLTALQPDLKVLYISGYTDDAIVHHGVLDAETAFLQKPFTPSMLARKIRTILDG